MQCSHHKASQYKRIPHQSSPTTYKNLRAKSRTSQTSYCKPHTRPMRQNTHASHISTTSVPFKLRSDPGVSTNGSDVFRHGPSWLTREENAGRKPDVSAIAGLGEIVRPVKNVHQHCSRCVPL